jgi:asparagine synthase (glutamine-hydrolysing)
MCGIVMIIGSQQEPSECKKILHAQQHRGRDHHAFISFANYHIGFNRLAIVDESSLGNQPFETDKYITVFNSEIYNHQTLRETYNIQTNSNSDIEIIAPLFELLGERIIDVLDGFYAGIIINKATNECFFLKDYIGKKPLFYVKTARFQCVASELKGITDVMAVEIIPKGISTLKNDALVNIRQHQFEKHPTAQLKLIIQAAVRKRIPLDNGKFGVFLSGGLDSSIIASIVETYTDNANYYCLGDENNEDNRFVKILAKALHIEDKVMYIPLPSEAQIHMLIPKIIYHTESYNPSIISNGLATYLLAREAAKDGLKVILSGEGADELFCGYAITKDKHQWFEARNILIENLHYTELRRLDMASMAATIEARCPFLDRSIYAIAKQLELNDLIDETDGLQGKHLLRQLFKDDLPKSIVQRKKMSCDVGSGIRKAVVEFSTQQYISEKEHLQQLWQGFFPSLPIAHDYFSSYPVFDQFITNRKATHKDVAILQKVEALVLEDYQSTPFHNLLMHTERTEGNRALGGTCSDKTLHFQVVLAAKGIQTQLHTAFINGEECHRLLLIHIHAKQYFIDVGSGWPCIKLFPAFADSSYTAFGIEFRSTLIATELIITMKTHIAFKPLMRIPLAEKSEEVIKEAIANRFHPSKTYPFQHSLRFSFVKDDQFFFLKGNTLRTYQDGNEYKEQQFNTNEIDVFIALHFPRLAKELIV